MGLEVGGGGTEKEEEEEEEKEKIPLCESIGHRPLRGRCPAPTLNYNHDLPKQGTGTADHLTLLRLFTRAIRPMDGPTEGPMVGPMVGPTDGLTKSLK